MPLPAGERASWLLVYVTTLFVGTVFSALLLAFAWNSALEAGKLDFSLRSLALENAFLGNTRAAHNAVNSLAAFMAARPDITPPAFAIVSGELLNQHPYLQEISYCPGLREGDGIEQCAPDLSVRPRRASAAGNAPVPADSARLFAQAARSHDVLAATLPGPAGEGRRFWLLRRVIDPGGNSAPDARFGVVAAVVDSRRLLDTIPPDMRVWLTLYNDQTHVGGRQELFRNLRQEGPEWMAADFEDEATAQFPMFSLRLGSGRNLPWNAFQWQGVAIAGLIGVGVTLLLVAFVRTRERQALELRQRNLVIERKVEEQTRELAVARDQALDASRIKSDFLASMSHEIRTPLNAIIGMADLLVETPLDQEQKKYIDIFRKAGDTLLSLVNDILDLSKIEAGQVELENIPFDLATLMEESAEIYALKAEEKGIELVCHVDPRVSTMRHGDPARLRQVILNLVSNALKFTESGEIVVRVRSPVHGMGTPGMLEFSVADSGIGIPPEKQEAIFASFTQVDSSTTRKYGGTGLGLTICRSLVEMMGGRIRVESETGQGSRFIFDVALPVIPGQETGAATGPMALGGRRVLLVDDNVHSRETVADYLAAAGMTVTTAGGPGEALALAAERPRFDATLVDPGVPGTDGFDVVTRLRDSMETGPVYVLLGTKALNESTDSLRTAGVSGYVLKPVKRGELYRVLHEAYAGPRDEGRDRAAQTESPGEPPRRILLVDDNPDNRLLIRSFLKKLPYEIVEAENGQIAVDLFMADRFDLVLMDVQMPVLDGHGATRTIRAWEKENGRAPTPVIALTAHAFREEIERCLESGCNAHVAKPVKKAQLQEIIRSYAGSGDTTGPS